MHAYSLTHVTDDKLLADLSSLVAKDRQTTAALLAHIAEVDARELFKPAAYSTMHAYCVGALHLSEDAAFKRLRAARAGRRFPQIFGAIAEGRVHLSGVVMLAPHLTADNVDQLIAAATHRSKAEIEILLAALAPQPDLPTRLTPLDSPSGSTDQLSLAPGPVEPPPTSPAPAPAPRVKALSPERYGLQVTISQATRDKLERATALLRHRNPSGDLAVVFDRALDALLAKLEKEKFGKTSRPRAMKARPEDADPRYIPNEVRRAVHERDGEQCTFVSEEGVRCTEDGFLEFDHETLVCRGGQPTVDGLRLRCKAHNQHTAERALGADFMRARRKRAAGKKSAQPVISDASAALRPTSDAATAASPAGDAATATNPISGAPTPTGPINVATTAASPPNVAAASTSHDADVTLALRGLGFKAEETRRAMANTARTPATTFEARLRAALAELGRSRPFRCSDGPVDVAGGWRTLDADASWRTDGAI